MRDDKYIEMTVTLDDGTDSSFSVKCLWESGDFWNGWLVPYFDRTGVQRIIDYVDSWNDPDTALKWDGDEVVEYSPSCPDDERRWAPVLIDGEPHWSVGGGSWCWQQLCECPDCKSGRSS